MHEVYESLLQPSSIQQQIWGAGCYQNCTQNTVWLNWPRVGRWKHDKYHQLAGLAKQVATVGGDNNTDKTVNNDLLSNRISLIRLMHNGQALTA